MKQNEIMQLILNLNDWFIVFKTPNLSCMFFNATQTTLVHCWFIFYFVDLPNWIRFFECTKIRWINVQIVKTGKIVFKHFRRVKMLWCSGCVSGSNFMSYYQWLHWRAFIWAFCNWAQLSTRSFLFLSFLVSCFYWSSKLCYSPLNMQLK